MKNFLLQGLIIAAVLTLVVQTITAQLASNEASANKAKFKLACVYPSGANNIWEFENSHKDTGSNPNKAWAYTGTFPYSKSIVKYDSYSMGMLLSYGSYISCTALNYTPKTIQFWIYIPAGTKQDNRYIAASYNTVGNIQLYSDNYIRCNYGNGMCSSYAVPFNTWVMIQFNWNGTNFSFYAGNPAILIQQIAYKGYPQNKMWSIFNYYDWADTYPKAYFDRFIIADYPANGVEIVPYVHTPTPQPSATIYAQHKQTAVMQLTAALEATTIATWFTPTPAHTCAICGTPFPAVFAQVQTPVLVPDADYEAGSVQCPDIITGADGLLHMAYWGSGWKTKGMICLATSPGPLGPWTKHGPLFGNGYGGVSLQVTDPCQIHIGNEWRIYFSKAGNIFYATSTDSYNYKLQPYFNPSNTVLDSSAFRPACVGGAGIDGLGIFTNGPEFWGIAELMADGCPDQSAYKLWLCKGTADALTFTSASQDALEGLDPWYPAESPFSLVTQGGRAAMKVGNRYHIWYGIDYPTKIYHAESYDLYNWYSSVTPVVSYSAHLFGLLGCNQVADPAVIEYQGKTYLYYSAVDNGHERSYIGVSVYNGTLAQYDNCGTTLPPKIR